MLKLLIIFLYNFSPFYMALQNIILERSDYIICVLQGRNTNSLVVDLSKRGEKKTETKYLLVRPSVSLLRHFHTNSQPNL